MEKISVIIPVYNAEKTIERCINSVLLQTYSNIELIIIDDGSTDSSLTTIKHIASNNKTNKEIKLISQENRGISFTRNFGMTAASGEWITFLDSDDFLEPTAYEKMYQYGTENHLDMVVTDYEEVYPNNKVNRINILFDGITNIHESPQIIYEINSSPWNKLYRKELIEKYQLQFPLNLKYEDVGFVLPAVAFAKRIGKLSIISVKYCIHEESETTIVDERVNDIFDILLYVNQRINNVCKNEEIKEAIEYFNILRITTYNLQQIYQKNRLYIRNHLKKSFLFLDSNFPEWRKNKIFKQKNSFMKQFIKKSQNITLGTVYLYRIFGKKI